MKAVWIGLVVVLLLVAIFLAMSYTNPTSLVPAMTASSVVAGAPGVMMATDPIETIAMHMHDGKLPVVY